MLVLIHIILKPMSPPMILLSSICSSKIPGNNPTMMMLVLLAHGHTTTHGSPTMEFSCPLRQSMLLVHQPLRSLKSLRHQRPVPFCPTFIARTLSRVASSIQQTVKQTTSLQELRQGAPLPTTISGIANQT